jgi:monoamine oxidase
VLNAPVRSIGQTGTGVTVVSDALTVAAKRVVVAVPPALAARIDYAPPPDGSPGVLAGFVGGTQNLTWGPRPVAERRAAVLAQYARIFGDPRFASPVDYFDMDWTTQEWSRGGPTAFAGPGTLTGYGPALRAPAGRIHWAGTETSDYWQGYMDGAVRSGERVAREITAVL